MKQELSDFKVINRELRNELTILKDAVAEAMQASAVDRYKLSEAEKTIETMKCVNLSDPSAASFLPRSEPYRIDEKFIGDDRTLYPAFKRQIRIALSQNADRYVSLQSQISLIYQNLGLGPKSFLDRYLMEDGKFAFASLTEVWNVLDVSFRNPNEEEDARDALSRLRQGNRPFGAYLSEFQRLQNMSCVSDDKTLIAFMRNGVSSNLNLCIGQQQVINKKYSFDEFVELCKECVIRLDWMRPSIRGAQNPIFPDLTPCGINPTQPVAGASPSNLGSRLATGSNSLPLGCEPMILDKSEISHIGPDGHITPEERLRRFKLKLCMRCGKPGHRANRCRPVQKNFNAQELNLEESSDLGENHPDLKD